MLGYLDALIGDVRRMPAQIVVVQPHVTRKRWEAPAAQNGPGAAWARRCQIDLLLWSLSDVAGGFGADVIAVGMDV